MSTTYKQENSEYINKKRNINKLNQGLFVTSECIEKYNISIGDLDVTKLHNMVNKTLLQNQKQTQIQTKSKLNKTLPINPNIWNKQYILSLGIKNVKENTLQQYISKTNVMLKELNFECLQECVKSTKFLEYIKTQKNTKRILALLIILVEHYNFEFNMNLLKEFHNELLEIEKKALLEHKPLVVCTYDDLIKKRNSITSNCIEKVIAYLYLDNTKMLFRSELNEIRLHTSNITHKAHYNWLNLNDGKLHLNKFKNSHKKPKEIIQLQGETMKVIRDYLKPYDLYLININYPEFLELFKSIFDCNIQQYRRVIETHNYLTMDTKDFILNCKSHTPEVAVQYYVGNELKKL